VSERFLLEDSSSSDESDIEDMILDDDVEQTMVIVAVKELQGRMTMKRRRILKELLVLCKLGLPLFGVQLVLGQEKSH
jgi:hypothetical protein